MISKIKIVAFSILLMGFPCFGALAGPDYSVTSGINFSIDCNDAKIRNNAYAFFAENLKVGATKKDISNLIKRFYFQFPIKNIVVNSNSDNQSFIIRIEPDLTVNQYVISGNDEIKKVDIIRELSQAQATYQGDNLMAELLEKMQVYYHYRGFPNAEITMVAEAQKETGTSKIYIRIKENKPCLINDVTFSGSNGPNGVKRIKKQFTWSRHPRCDLETALDQARKLREKYNRRRYFQFDLKNPRLDHVSEDKLSANLIMDLYIGRQISLEFNGNRYAFERDELLKKAIFFDQEKKFNQGFENTAISGIRTFYDNHGYPYSKVEIREKSKAGKRKIVFDIDRGSVVRLKNIKFQGNTEVSSKKLLRQFRLLSPIWTRKRYWIPSDLPLILNGLVSYYQSMGYLRAYFYEPAVNIDKAEHKAKLQLKLSEGAQSFINEFNIQGNSFVSRKDVMKFFNVKKGDPVDPLSMRDSAQKLEYEYQTRGFKYAKVQLSDIETIEEGYNDYNITVEEGPRIRIGDILIQGNYSTKNYVITRELAIKSGDLLNPEQIRESRRRLLRLGFFQSLLIEEKVRDDVKDVEDIVISVVERKKRSFILRPGVSTDDGARFTGTLSYSNILGTGRNTSLSGSINHRFDSDAIMEHRILATYLEPKIFNFMDGKVNLIQERFEEPGFDLSRRTIIVGVEKNLSSWLRTTLQWVLEFRDPFRVQQDIILSDLDQSKARFGSLSSIVDFDFRDNLLNASRGSFHRIQFDYYNKVFLSDADFYQFYIRNSFFFPIYRRFRSVLSVRAGFSGTTGQTKQQGITDIPIEKRFRLGGNTSLRGFGFNCVGGNPSNASENCSSGTFSGTSQSFLAPGGNSMINYLWDFLIPLTSTVDLAIFTDGGNAFATNSMLDVLDIRTTAGFGLRYNTVVGPLRVDYGIKLDRRTGESFGEIHFAVGQF